MFSYLLGRNLEAEFLGHQVYIRPDLVDNVSFPNFLQPIDTSVMQKLPFFHVLNNTGYRQSFLIFIVI